MALVILAVAFLTAEFSAPQANAVTINGSITISGGAAFDTDSLATATRVNTFSDVGVTSRDGDFTSFVGLGDTVTMSQPWIFGLSMATADLWSADGFSYDLSSSIVVSQNADFLLITGTGTIFGHGFDPTSGTWSYTSHSPSGTGVFTFSADGNVSVADGGITIALLGISLIALEVLRRRLAAA
jgi:hypothetical protein